MGFCACTHPTKKLSEFTEVHGELIAMNKRLKLMDFR